MRVVRVLCCGDRNWSDYRFIQQTLVELRTELGENVEITIIHGGARGADRMAGIAAARLGYHVLVFPAQWDTYGKAAGVIRNQQMLDEGEPELVLAFHYRLDESKGTKDMVKRARNANISVRVLPEDRWW